jgi:hypothetical protein
MRRWCAGRAAPLHLPVATIREVVVGFPGVVALRLHVSTLGAGHDAITVHVRTGSRDPAFGRCLSQRIRDALGAEYVTVQVSGRKRWSRNMSP